MVGEIVDFTKTLLSTFTRAYPKSAKNRVKLSVSFVLCGSIRVKGASKVLVKLTPDAKALMQCIDYVLLESTFICSKKHNQYVNTLRSCTLKQEENIWRN